VKLLKEKEDRDRKKKRERKVKRARKERKAGKGHGLKEERGGRDDEQA